MINSIEICLVSASIPEQVFDWYKECDNQNNDAHSAETSFIISATAAICNPHSRVVRESSSDLLLTMHWQLALAALPLLFKCITADCCNPTYGLTDWIEPHAMCADGSKAGAAMCCGVGSCNVFCCDCEDGMYMIMEYLHSDCVLSAFGN